MKHDQLSPALETVTHSDEDLRDGLVQAQQVVETCEFRRVVRNPAFIAFGSGPTIRNLPAIQIVMENQVEHRSIEIAANRCHAALRSVVSNFRGVVSYINGRRRESVN